MRRHVAVRCAYFYHHSSAERPEQVDGVDILKKAVLHTRGWVEAELYFVLAVLAVQRMLHGHVQCMHCVATRQLQESSLCMRCDGCA